MERKALIDNFHEKMISSGSREGYVLAGWSSKKSQNDRFDALLRSSQFAGGTVIDYGCGVGDLYAYLAAISDANGYRGYDQNQAMIDVATSKYGSRFQRIEIDSTGIGRADYVFASGVFQFSDQDRREYHKILLRNLFHCCEKAVAVNFLSDQRSSENKVPSELYVSASDIATLARSISGFWTIDHSYHGGGGDLTLALFKRQISATWARPPH